MRTLLTGGTIVSSQGRTGADVLVDGGIILRIAEHIDDDTAEKIDCTGKLLFPGLIDPHVHCREPGLTHKGTMKSEAAAARAGGITTIFDMPNTIPPTVTVEALDDKVGRAQKIKNVDVRFFFGVTQWDHLQELRRLSTESQLSRLKERCVGVKLYLDHSTGNQGIEQNLLDEAFKTCAELGLIIVGHCEDPTMNANAATQNTRKDVAAHSLIRPAESEVVAIDTAINLAHKHGARFHVAHISTERGLHLVRQAKGDGLSVTCEAAPHHLIFTTDDYEKFGTRIKVNPPIRSREHVEAMWQGIADKTIDCIATDHAPHTLEEKLNPDQLKAPSGMPALEVSFPIMLSIAGGKWPHHKSSHIDLTFTIEDVVRLMFENPNRIFQLGKEGVVESSTNPILIVDPDVEWEIDGAKLHSLCGWSPYQGMRVKGAVVRVVS